MTCGKYLIEMKLEAKYMAQCFTVVCIRFQQWQKQSRLVNSTLKRLQDHIKNSIWIKVETAYK